MWNFLLKIYIWGHLTLARQFLQLTLWHHWKLRLLKCLDWWNNRPKLILFRLGLCHCGISFYRCGMCGLIKWFVQSMAHTSVVMVLISGRTQFWQHLGWNMMHCRWFLFTERYVYVLWINLSFFSHMLHCSASPS